MPKNKYSKGKVVHRTKKTAKKIVKSCKEIGIPCKLRKLKKGYRVDKNWN